MQRVRQFIYKLKVDAKYRAEIINNVPRGT